MPSTVLTKQCGAMEDHGLDAMLIIAPENAAWTSGILAPSREMVRHRHTIARVPKDGDQMRER